MGCPVVIVKIGRGGSFAGLTRYLVGPGRRDEHREPHLVAGDPAVLPWFAQRELSGEDASPLAKFLDAPREAHGVSDEGRIYRWDDDKNRMVHDHDGARHVYHASLSLAADEGQLSDEKWGAIAERFAAKMGFADPDDPRTPARWVAVRHGLSSGGNDHVHLVFNTVRDDGTKVNLYKDYQRASEAAAQIESEFDLQRVEGRDGQVGAKAAPQAEEARRLRLGLPERESETLERITRAAATASADEAEFVRRLRQHQVQVRPWFAKGSESVVTGYSLRLRSVGIDGEHGLWRKASLLAHDLKLDQLRRGWPDSPEHATAAAAEWRAGQRGLRPAAPGRELQAPDDEAWKKWHTEVSATVERLREAPAGSADWSLAAREASGTLAAWSVRVEGQDGGPLADASRVLARSARVVDDKSAAAPTRPARSPAAGGGAVLLAMAATSGRGRVVEAIVLRELIRLGQSVHQLHQQAGRTTEAARIENVMRHRLASVRATLPTPVPIEQLGRLGTVAPTSAATWQPQAPHRPGIENKAKSRPPAEPARTRTTPGVTPDRGVERE